MDEVEGASGFSHPMRRFESHAAGSSGHEDDRRVPGRNFLTLQHAYIDRFLLEDNG